jgi:hypothetical protein
MAVLAAAGLRRAITRYSLRNAANRACEHWGAAKWLRRSTSFNRDLPEKV